MNSIGPVVAKLSFAVLCVLQSVHISNRRRAEKQSANRGIAYLQAICIEISVAFTLFIYAGWLCFQKWLSDELIITYNNMLLGCFLVLTAALGTKLCWIIWSAFQSRFNK